MIDRLCILMTAMLAASTPALAQEARFLSKIKLPSGETVVVAEGDNEARSTGSFSVRLYDGAEPGDETTFFSSGLIEEREGTVETVTLADLDNDKKEEIVVQIRSAGTGGYLSAIAFEVKDKKLRTKGKIADLAPGADVIDALQKSLTKKR